MSRTLAVPRGIRASEGYARVTAISQTLKTFSRNTKTAVVALAQLSRPGKNEPYAPTMHSFKESGQLEQDADAAFLVYPIDKNDTGSNRMFCVAKNKEGLECTTQEPSGGRPMRRPRCCLR